MTSQRPNSNAVKSLNSAPANVHPSENSLTRHIYMPLTTSHVVNGRPITAPYTDDTDLASHLNEVVLGLGCFWGAERKFYNTPGVYSTAVGYAAGHAKNPTYNQVCQGVTGHTEVVLVVFDTREITLEGLLQVFFESHNPTQGMRQGNDIGTQYRSGVYCLNDNQVKRTKAVLDGYQSALADKGFGPITTETKQISDFYYAEDYHQQYLAKNPSGYCGLGGTGVTCAI